MRNLEMGDGKMTHLSHEFSLIELVVLHDLPLSTVTNQLGFDQRDSNSSHKFERAMDRRCQMLVSKLETLVPSLLLI